MRVTKGNLGSVVFCIDVGSFVIKSWVTAGHEIESEVGICIDVGLFVIAN